MKALSIVLTGSMITICCILGVFAHKTYNQFCMIEESILILQEKLIDLNQAENPSVPVQPVDYSSYQNISASSCQLWLRLQKNLQNTVVQLFVTNAEHNILQPYKTPQQGRCTGSGFIINEQGEMITNAHVVNGSTCIMAQITAFGKHQFEVDLVGLMPEKDFALVKFRPDDVEMIVKTLGKMPFLPLGDSDSVMRSQEIIALGYPLGQQSLKSTTGVVSGREGGSIQISAAINPGSSGGPSVDCCGNVIGINSSGIMSAQNVGYVIPINDIKPFLNDLRAGGLVRKPYLGLYQSIGTEELVKALGNPLPGGTYVVDVLTDSPLYGQMKPGDMIYEINGISIDLYGEMIVPWSEDKISTSEYIARLAVGQKVSMTVYRKGKKMCFECTFDRKKLAPIRQVFTEYEELPFEAFGGYVVMPFMLNHLQFLLPVVPTLIKYSEEKNQGEPLLVVTHVMQDSPAYRARLHIAGSILKKVNGIDVKTLDDLRKALLHSGEIITVETTDNILIALCKEKVLKAERSLATIFGYKITQGMVNLMQKENQSVAVQPVMA
ncbi:MAG: trypsin-like peptidase domain-containing protein [Candidatus Dependentiae bacterium]|nr:trypsin-like peptidase domain-containing protein [Candidatus Dependentiae bacterium]